ncbi:MAG: hypothetical protein ACFFAO_18620, partial [Candidatus Hermodarchaeota archaeon]
MGLYISINFLGDLALNDSEGFEWESKSINDLNEVLRENNYHAFKEPTEYFKLRYRAQLRGFPYSWIHYLRRFAAHV